VVVYGSRADGHARVVLETLLVGQLGFDVLGLLDDEPENAGRRIGEFSVIGTRLDLAALCEDGVEGVVLGFGAVEGREAIVEAVEAAGLALPILVHSSAHVSPSATLGSGVQVLPQASIGPGARIGRGVLINTGAIVEHDATLSDCTVIGPGAVLAGRTTVAARVEVGARAVLLPDTEIGADAVVGAGAVVTRVVAEGQTVVGVPARRLESGATSS
jgi:sugar O-acyltransferase (sialic acid O-acetyltransferase NeuD family)